MGLRTDVFGPAFAFTLSNVQQPGQILCFGCPDGSDVHFGSIDCADTCLVVGEVRRTRIWAHRTAGGGTEEGTLYGLDVSVTPRDRRRPSREAIFCTLVPQNTPIYPNFTISTLRIAIPIEFKQRPLTFWLVCDVGSSSHTQLWILFVEPSSSVAAVVETDRGKGIAS
uniref:Uncharacterized protein n=1 Tax=Ananas comosus var. bracteatus TaxID=296719 RepID=A0A6V7Q9E4_ANACO|nr:unnamed protein product [Ananas comosus var. bracteatus]